ncbi:MAG: GLPGLI family protein [Prevotellaceae bacterium]|jgi:GLPGLI family protein|nr:GLPGLI family protein [Prevotellaceae bacterium]
MKKTVILTASLILFTMQIIAQEILDTAYLGCSYRFTLMSDTIEKTKSIKDADMRLLTGNKCSKFYSYTTFVRDSFMNSIPNEKEFFLDMMAKNGFDDFRKQHPLGETYKIYVSHNDQTILYTDIIMTSRISYKEPVPKQNWKILNEIKEIAGYKCQKATCTFRGRDYAAWFTREIPVNEGPWKFNGLPGLIVKVYDTQEHYDFELYAVNKIKKAVVIEENNYKNVSINDHIKMRRDVIKNPIPFGKVTDNEGNIVIVKPLQYDVMERDVK